MNGYDYIPPSDDCVVYMPLPKLLFGQRWDLYGCTRLPHEATLEFQMDMGGDSDDESHRGEVTDLTGPVEVTDLTALPTSDNSEPSDDDTSVDE